MSANFDAVMAVLDRIEGAQMRLEKKLDQIINQTAPHAPADDESIGRDPSEKYWQGASHKGCRMSECPPDFLRAYAKYRSACAWAARKNDADKPEKMKYADRDEKSAKLATQWAEYREALGYSHVPAPAQSDGGTPEEAAEGLGSIPF